MARTGNREAYYNAKKFADLRDLSLKETATRAGLGVNAIYGWRQYGVSQDGTAAVAKVLGVKPGDIHTERKAGDGHGTPIDLGRALDQDRPLLYDGQPLDSIDRTILRRMLGHR